MDFKQTVFEVVNFMAHLILTKKIENLRLELYKVNSEDNFAIDLYKLFINS